MKYNLMSVKEYAKIKHKSPYVYQLKNKNKFLLVLGSKHSNNPKDSQFSSFKKHFIDFKPDCIFVEGGAEKGEWTKRFKSEKEVIKISEMAFLTFLAEKNNVPVLSWEPGEKKEIEFLLKKYNKEDLFAHFLIRVIPQYVRWNNPKGYLEREIKSFKNLTKWKKFDYSIKNLKKIHIKIFGKELRLDSERLYNLPPYPVEDVKTIGKSVLNKIAADEMKFRDTYAVKKIIKSFNKYDKILAIAGSGHAVVQEPVYREFFTKLRV